MSAKSHSIVIPDDEYQSLFINGWMPSYNQRALLCRILYKSRDRSGKHSCIQKVKLISKENGEETFSCIQDVISNIEDFYSVLDDSLQTFDKSVNEADSWKDMVDFIELSQFKYESIDGMKRWTTVTPDLSNRECAEKFNKLSLDSQFYLSAFTAALKSDMRSGQAKHWMCQLVNLLLECLKTTDGLSESESKLNVWAPARHCNTNTSIETLLGETKNLTTQIVFDSPYFADSNCDADDSSSSSSSESSAESDCIDKRISRRTIVPDVCVALQHSPGMFPLVVKLQPAGDESQGLERNIKQMISKLFYQDVVFGLTVSTRQFQISAIQKCNKNLHILSMTPISFCTYRNEDYNLDLKALEHMCTFIYRVLKWSIKSKCLITEEE